MTDPYQVIERAEEHDYIIRDMRDGQEYGRYDSKVSAFNAALRLKNKEMGDLLTTKQAAAELGVTVQRIGQLCTSGGLKATKVGRDWVIARAALATVDRGVAGYPKGRPRKEEQ